MFGCMFKKMEGCTSRFFVVQWRGYFDASSDNRETHDETGLPSCTKAEATANLHCFQASRKSEKVSLTL